MFANIAAMGINNTNKNLIVPQPMELKQKQFTLSGVNPEASFQTTPKMDTKKELDRMVAKEKEYYRPFFAELAPTMTELRAQKNLQTFQWRIGTDTDAKEFAGVLAGNGDWDTINIPHYGEPLGVATTYYRTSFQLTQEELTKGSLWVNFKGVDYKAHVFLNGNFIGSHEGFFAPFTFDFTNQALLGENILVVMVENDFICMGNIDKYQGEMFTGDKIYAATGLGYEDPLLGWHHCPAGMGIYQDVAIEIRDSIFIDDIFVRPILKDNIAEIWLEIYNTKPSKRDISIDISIYGQNFESVVIEHDNHRFHTGITVGLGDTFTEAKLKGEGLLGSNIKLYMEKGINYVKIPITMESYRLWELATPWLYQVQVAIRDENDTVVDTKKSHFGMREFTQDQESTPKGKFYLNGKETRLRGANTMGHEQRCVYQKDWEQLLTDLILAKVCNMNFLRLTQRPVQPEVYDYCDKLGLMIQTDLPHFAAIRRNQFLESVKQAVEMEHLVRSHPCVIMVTYINEPFPNAKDMPHRNLTRPEMEQFFQIADTMVHMTNPDRVIKHIDGDYDPPTGGLPDNHCYPGWYNGHGIDMGKLHKGYWMMVKDGWHYGCGEYGIEGLDCVEVMEKYYPKEWLTTDENGAWSAEALIGAQTSNFHYFFYETPTTMKDWVKASQKHQAQALKMMTDAYRRDCRMNTFACHLFIDAYPCGWMKTIMDVDRNPKPAFFAYRNALKPTMINLRADRQKIMAGETIGIEAWVCNDTQEIYPNVNIHVQIEEDGCVTASHMEQSIIAPCTSMFQGYVSFIAPLCDRRKSYTIRVALIDTSGKIIDHDSYVIEVFPTIKTVTKKVCVLGATNEKWLSFQKDLSCEEIPLAKVEQRDTIIVLDYATYMTQEDEVLAKVKKGTNIIFFTLEKGSYKIGEDEILLKDCGMLPVHFASRDTGHEIVAGLAPDDVKHWYDPEVDYITPFLKVTFDHDSYTDILTMGNQDNSGKWKKVSALGEKIYGAGHIIICQVELVGRTAHNPVAKILAERILTYIK